MVGCKNHGIRFERFFLLGLLMIEPSYDWIRYVTMRPMVLLVSLFLLGLCNGIFHVCIPRSILNLVFLFQIITCHMPQSQLNVSLPSLYRFGQSFNADA